MKKIIEYQNAMGQNSAELQEMVNLCIKAGWQPIGGVALLTFPLSTPLFYQSLVKYEE